MRRLGHVDGAAGRLLVRLDDQYRSDCAEDNVTNASVSSFVRINEGKQDHLRGTACTDHTAAKSLPHVLGLASDGWVGSASLAFEHNIATANGTYDGFKTYTYVTGPAAARTSIRIEAPDDGMLFYTSGSKWNSQLTDRQVIEGATRSVTLSGCRSDLTGYAGELLLKRPTCVRLLVVAHRRGTDVRRRFAVPMGTHC